MPGADYQNEAFPEPTPENPETLKNRRSLIEELENRIKQKGGESVEIKPNGELVMHDYKEKCEQLSARITQLEGAIANIIKICDRPRETGDVFVVRELASDALSKPSSSMEVIRKCVEWVNKAHHLDGCCRRYAPYRVGENSTACDCGRKDLLAEVRREFSL